VLTPPQISQVVAAIEQALPPRAGTPAPTDPSPPTPPTPTPTPRRTTTSVGGGRPSRPKRRQPTPTPKQRRTLVARAELAVLRAVIGVIAFVVLVAVAFFMINAALQSMNNIVMPLPGSAGSPSSPTEAHVEWSCPVPGSGWTGTLSWTPSVTPGSSYQAEWGDAVAGPFRSLPSAGSAATVTAVPPGTTGSYRIRALLLQGGKTYRSLDLAGAADPAPAEAC
jgi:hypothetical protein